MAKTIVTPEYASRLTAAIKRELPDATVTPREIDGRRYSLEIVSPSFNGVDHADRQARLWKIADRVLSRDELYDLSVMIAVAEDEMYQ